MPMIVHVYTWFTHGGVEANQDKDGRVFFSTYEGAIDAKGRVSIPAPFRAALGGNTRVFIWVAPDGSGALEGGGEALMELYKNRSCGLPVWVSKFCDKRRSDVKTLLNKLIKKNYLLSN